MLVTSGPPRGGSSEMKIIWGGGWNPWVACCGCWALSQASWSFIDKKLHWETKADCSLWAVFSATPVYKILLLRIVGWIWKLHFGSSSSTNNGILSNLVHALMLHVLHLPPDILILGTCWMRTEMFMYQCHNVFLALWNFFSLIFFHWFVAYVFVGGGWERESI